MTTVVLSLLAACQGVTTRPADTANTETVFPAGQTAVPPTAGVPEALTKEVTESASADLRLETPTAYPTTTVEPSEQQTTEVATAPEPTREPVAADQSTSAGVHSESSSAASTAIWSFDGTNWKPDSPAPTCADPFVVQTPVDMGQVTGALWPGQSRGGYKGHGGFSFDLGDVDNVEVRAPVGSHLVQASKYLNGDDEQILLFFSAPCGFFYRFDHVRGLSPKIADALKVIPTPTSNDSRTTRISPPVWIEQGEVVADSVGIPNFNIFVDFGLYDVRTPNNVVPNSAWADLFANDKEFGHYGVCFFDYLPGSDGDFMRSLPTGKEGTTSDYCE